MYDMYLSLLSGSVTVKKCHCNFFVINYLFSILVVVITVDEGVALIISSHHIEEHGMRSIVVHVAWSLCVFVDHDRESCTHGWTDRDAV